MHASEAIKLSEAAHDKWINVVWSFERQAGNMVKYAAENGDRETYFNFSDVSPPYATLSQRRMVVKLLREADGFTVTELDQFAERILIEW